MSTVEYGPQKAIQSHLPLSPSSIIWTLVLLSLLGSATEIIGE